MNRAIALGYLKYDYLTPGTAVKIAFGDGETDGTVAELPFICGSWNEDYRNPSDLIAVMAQALDEDSQKALTQTSQWQAYLESRRRMEATREDVEKFRSHPDESSC